MAGETVKTEAICLSIAAWSKTSHVVNWLTPHGRVATIVKGAVRPKSAFLGQYDLNYTCEILYYARAKGELHALRECTPVRMREQLRDDYRALAFAAYARALAERFAPQGPECEEWYAQLAAALDKLTQGSRQDLVGDFVALELRTLELMGLMPEISRGEEGYYMRGERIIPLSEELAEYLRHPKQKTDNSQIPLDATRVIGVFYLFHVDMSAEIRRTVLRLISRTT